MRDQDAEGQTLVKPQNYLKRELVTSEYPEDQPTNGLKRTRSQEKDGKKKRQPNSNSNFTATSTSKNDPRLENEVVSE